MFVYFGFAHRFFSFSFSDVLGKFLSFYVFLIFTSSFKGLSCSELLEKSYHCSSSCRAGYPSPVKQQFLLLIAYVVVFFY